MMVGPRLLSDVSRGILIIAYIILIVGAIIAATGIRVYFTKMYFVSDSSEIKRFLDAEDQYFKVGGEVTVTYIDNQDESFDLSSVESQNHIYALCTAI